jgi:hypothetical protein
LNLAAIGGNILPFFMADVEGKREYELKNSQAIGSQFFMVNGNVNNNINFNDNINLKTYNLQPTTYNSQQRFYSFFIA